uniref:Uncharacterized protein n=1 Tax=Rhizophora mucronata TaxID=61149 RepID=A0A2P2NYL1_RHIMU
MFSRPLLQASDVFIDIYAKTTLLMSILFFNRQAYLQKIVLDWLLQWKSAKLG